MEAEVSLDQMENKVQLVNRASLDKLDLKGILVQLDQRDRMEELDHPETKEILELRDLLVRLLKLCRI